MNKIVKNIFEAIAMCTILFLLMVLLIYKITEPENWYASMHDSFCEGENCHCYERFVAAEKN